MFGRGHEGVECCSWTMWVSTDAAPEQPCRAQNACCKSFQGEELPQFAGERCRRQEPGSSWDSPLPQVVVLQPAVCVLDSHLL